MKPDFTWRCACGRILLSTDIQPSGAIGRIMLTAECPTCGRERRRGFYMSRGTYKAISKMLRALDGHVTATPVRWIDKRSDRLEGSPYLKRLAEYMLVQRYGVDQTHRLLIKLIGHDLSREWVRRIGAELRIKTLKLLNAPPFCRDVLRGGEGKLNTLLNLQEGQLTDLCHFCTIPCSRDGLRCQMIKATEKEFRFVQFGRD